MADISVAKERIEKYLVLASLILKRARWGLFLSRFLSIDSLNSIFICGVIKSRSLRVKSLSMPTQLSLPEFNINSEK